MALNISAGLYEVTLPDDWEHVPLESDGIAYFERTDKKLGVYVRALDFTSTEQAGHAEEIAQHVQQVHATSFQRLKEVPWTSAASEPQASTHGFSSIHVRYDAKNHYRIVSHVQVDGRQGCHITIHNYICKDPRQSDREASNIIHTVLRATEA